MKAPTSPAEQRITLCSRYLNCLLKDLATVSRIDQHCPIQGEECFMFTFPSL